MKLRQQSKLVFAAVIGLAFSALTSHAQLMVNVSQKATFGPFVGGLNNAVTNNGSTNTVEVITSGTPAADPFSITYTPATGMSMVTLLTGTLVTTNLVFDSPINPASYFSSTGMSIETDFDSNGSVDLVQNYSIALTPFISGNGFTGVSYAITPQQFFGSVTINGTAYGYASVVANSAGVLFDGSTTMSAIQFQFVATPVPEPSTYALGGVLALGAIVALRRRRAASSAVALAV